MIELKEFKEKYKNDIVSNFTNKTKELSKELLPKNIIWNLNDNNKSCAKAYFNDNDKIVELVLDITSVSTKADDKMVQNINRVGLTYSIIHHCNEQIEFNIEC